MPWPGRPARAVQGPDRAVQGLGRAIHHRSRRTYAGGTNRASSMSFQVAGAAFDAEVAALRDNGVTFQTFDAPGISWDDGVAAMGGDARGVWFADPDGNILNVETGVNPG